MNKEQELKSIKRSMERLVERIDVLTNTVDQPSFHNLSWQEKLDYILDGASDYWGIQRKELLKKGRVAISRKGYIAVVLRDYIGMRQDDIASLMGYANHSNVTTMLQNMDEKLSDQPWGDSRMRAVYKSLIQFLELPEQKHVL